MARLQWALTCRDTSIDSNTNNITYRDAIEQLRIKGFPVELPHLFLIAVLWRRDDLESQESAQYRVAVEKQDQGRVAQTEAQDIDLEGYERMRSAIPNPEIEVEGPTTLWFVIEKNEDDSWEEATRLPVEIKEAPDEVVAEAIEDVAEPQ